MKKAASVSVAILLGLSIIFMTAVALADAINYIFENDCATIAAGTSSTTTLNPEYLSNAFALTHATQTIKVVINGTASSTVGLNIYSGQALSWDNIKYTTLSVYNTGAVAETVCVTHAREAE
jgi:hypothetical protein